jgi:four helix bundle protein
MQDGKLKMENDSMESSNLIQNKAYTFALEIVRFSRERMQLHEYVLSKQLLRSGTSIGANVEEAQQAQSKNDFTSKMNIALKEAYETRYWLRLMKDSDIKPSSKIGVLLSECEHIIRLLASIVKSSRLSPNRSKTVL